MDSDKRIIEKFSEGCIKNGGEYWGAGNANIHACFKGVNQITLDLDRKVIIRERIEDPYDLEVIRPESTEESFIDADHYGITLHDMICTKRVPNSKKIPWF